MTWKSSLRRHWQEMGISSKLGLCGLLFFSLIIIVAATGYGSLHQVRLAEKAIMTGADIQRLVLDMDRGMERSRRLYAGFFLHYPVIGFEQAHEQYIQPSIIQISKTIAASNTLKTRLETMGASSALRQHHIDLNLYLSSAQRFAGISIESVELVTKISAPGTGYEARLTSAMQSLEQSVLKNRPMAYLFHDMQSHILNYWTSRKRHLMQSAFNTADQISGRIKQNPQLNPGEKESMGIDLEMIHSLGKLILETDVAIKSKINDISLQEKATAPISKSLIALADREMEKARIQITDTHSITIYLMAGIFILSALGTLGIWRLLNNSITRKLVELTHGAKAFRNDHLDVIVPTDSRDEIGELARTFNIMAKQIKDAIHHLESKVAQRTSELKTSNEQLRREVDDRIRAQAGLRKAQAMLQAALDNSQAGILIADANSGDVQYINEVGLRVMGEKTIPETFNIFNYPRRFKGYHPDGTPMKNGDYPLTYALTHGEPITLEYFVRFSDGIEYHRLANASPIFNENGEIYAGISFFLDITEQKTAEKEKENLELQLRQARKMEAIGTLAGGIAHDFNNILAAILGYADLALFDLPDDHPAAPRIEEVINAGNRAKNLVSQILAFSRKSGKGLVRVKIQRVINEAVHLLRASLPAFLEIITDVDPQCPPVLADPTQIHQVILNLCTNAAQAMEENGGTLSVSLTSITLTRSDLSGYPDLEPGPHACLTIHDTGTGIDKEIMDRIFDPYFTTKAVGQGSGMGLAMVHGIVKSHKGMVLVDSTPESGTRFRVLLPGTKEPPPSPPRIIARTVSGSGHILVVDDEASLVDITGRQLERLGYKVTARTDSQEALSLFKSRPDTFDIIVTDQTMPHMTGDQMARQMRNVRPDIPIILCTGYSAMIDKDKAERIGIKAFILKPVDISELSQTISTILGH